MNIVRKMQTTRSTASAVDRQSSSVGSRSSSEAPTGDTVLAMMHLRKVFNDLQRSSKSAEEREMKLCPVVRLFLKVNEIVCPVQCVAFTVFAFFYDEKVSQSFTVADIVDRFKEAALFASMISTVLVNEIRARAVFPSTVDAAVEMMAYLKPASSNSDLEPYGWSILSALALLMSSNQPDIVDAVCKTTLPSTLVKSLYLFCDLPKGDGLENEEIKALRGALMKVMIPVIRSQQGIEQVASKDDLVLLFCSVSSWCPKHNQIWRSCSSELLMTLSSRVSSAFLVSYIHEHKCIQLFVDNLRHASQESLVDLVDLVCCLLCVLKDFASVTTVLSDDFKLADGYEYLSDFVLEHSKSNSRREQDALRNLLFVIGSVVTAGSRDSKSPEPISRKSVAQSLSEGRTVRNANAFEVLETVFILSSNTFICCAVLDVLQSIFSADPRNYFLLETRCPLGKFVETVTGKSLKVQQRLFDLIEYVVFQLNYLPSKELIAVGPVLKMTRDLNSTLLIVKSLHKILNHSAAVKDLFRDVGLLDVLTTVLQNAYACVKNEADSDKQSWECLTLIVSTLCQLFKQCNANVVVFREIGGTKTVFVMISDGQCRSHGLRLLQQVMMNPSGEDELAGMLAALHSSPSCDVTMRSEVLLFLSNVLRESHRVRMAFRRVGGYVYLLSMVHKMSGALKTPAGPPWTEYSSKQRCAHLHNILKALTMSMRFEPSNAMFFQNEVKFGSLTDSIRLLGCFAENKSFKVIRTIPGQVELNGDLLLTMGAAFNFNLDSGNTLAELGSLSSEFIFVCVVLRMLYDMAFDRFDRSGEVMELKCETNSTGSLVYRFLPVQQSSAFVVHSGAVMCMFELLSYIRTVDEREALNLQLFLVEIVRSILRSERNQQMMCNAGLPKLLFDTVAAAYREDDHPLLPPLYYVLERLAAQGMTASEFRKYMRIDESWCCADLDSDEPTNVGGSFSLNRMKTLVSMTTPKDLRMSWLNASPAFVEFDMSIEGFGCIFLPSIAPMGPAVGQLGAASPLIPIGRQDTSRASLSGGLGVGERLFPPVGGLTFLCWLYVEKFSEAGVDAHPLRLLTLYRSFQNVIQPNQSQKSFDSFVSSTELACLQVQLSPADRSLLIGTYETDTPGADLDKDVGNSEGFVRIAVDELRRDRQWNHLSLVFNRSLPKNSSVSVYVNGVLHSTSRISYLCQGPALSGSMMSQLSAVSAIIGTMPGPFRKQSCLQWRLGTTYLIEEAISASHISQIFHLGPQYGGCFQAPLSSNEKRLPSLIAEEKVSFGLRTNAVSTMTLARLRKIYNKVDSRAIGKLLGISSHENITPVRVMHNSAVHLSGPARSIGGVIVGYLGMRTFCPRPVSKLYETVGGVSCILGLVSMAEDTETLYVAIKALFCALKTNQSLSNEMERMRGYQILSILLKEKMKLLNAHSVYMLFSMVGTLDVSRETVVIPNLQAFEDLLCDLCVWNRASADVLRMLYEHFYHLITEPGSNEVNLTSIRQVELLPRLLYTVYYQPELLKTTKDVVFNLISAILHPPADNISIVKFGQFIAASVYCKENSFPERSLPSLLVDLQETLFSQDVDLGEPKVRTAYTVYIRIRCMNLLLNILMNTGGSLNYQLCEQVSMVLGFDWLMSLMSLGCHEQTVVTALRILMIIIRHKPLLTKFREGIGNGDWLRDAERVLQNKTGVLLGFSMSTRSGGSVGSVGDVNPEVVGHVPGFVALQYLLPYHAHLVQVHLICLALMVGRPLRDVPSVAALHWEIVWNAILGSPKEHSWSGVADKVNLCHEAALPVLAIVRRCITINAAEAWCRMSCVTMVQFLSLLYHNCSEFSAYAGSTDFVLALASALLKDNYSDKQNQKPDKGTLSNHPAVRYVLELLATITVDSFFGAQTSRGESVVDVVLGLASSGSGPGDHKEFLWAFFSAVMERVEATDILARGINGMPVSANDSQTTYSSLAFNIFQFSARLVDCLWNGWLPSDPQPVLNFLLKLFSQVKRKSGSGVPLDGLYASLNRCILFTLSRPLENTKVQTSMIDCLQKVTASRSLIFAPANGSQDFIVCLAHLLFRLSNPSVLAKSKPEVANAAEHEASNKQLFQENCTVLQNWAKRVWEELFLSRKRVLEEALAVTVVPEVSTMRALGSSAAEFFWSECMDGEMKCTGNKEISQITQLQSKLSLVADGLQRLTGSKRMTRHATSGRIPVVSQKTLLAWIQMHISLIYELLELQHTRYMQWHQHTEKWCLEEWNILKQDLTRQRGLWGPRNPSQLDKFMLDTTEGPCRMRKKLIPNPLFYVCYPYRPHALVSENKSSKNKLAYSHDSRAYVERVRARQRSCFDLRIVDHSQPAFVRSEQITDFVDEFNDVNSKMIRHSISSSVAGSGSESHNDDMDESTVPMDGIVEPTASESVVTSNSGVDVSASSLTSVDRSVEASPKLQLTKEPDNQTLLRLLEEGEELSAMYRCARINGLDSMEGLLLFGRDHYYIVDGFTLLKSREIRDLDFLPPSLHDPIVPYIASGSWDGRTQKRQCSKFAYEDIRECHKRRYLLQPSAVEVFSADGRNYLLAFPKKIRDKVYSKFLNCAKCMTDVGHQSVSGQKSWVDVEQGAGFFNSLMGETSVTQRWVRGEISNFQYLMHLNTLAGRSYNDLSQYPVFPWILKDYDSMELDLTNPKTFRDLSKPMGAQTEERLSQFLKRYQEWDDPSGETPAYMYGTHYSSAMIVLSYLVRLEPFTQQFLKLQGGHFDLADRMFHCIKDAWISASKNNMADVKELIPEFFYLPDFLVNSNHFELGTKQSGVHLNDVILPPWAKGDPREFVRMHREALESDYVSNHLHEWIDLIFGYKQQGQAAIQSSNYFHHLFYEANVNFDDIQDPLTKNATLGFINNFGQIPSQLFKKPHPVKRQRLPAALTPLVPDFVGSGAAGGGGQLTAQDGLFYHVCDSLKPPLNPTRELRQAVGQIVQNDKGLLFAVEQNKVLVQPQCQKYLAWGFADNSIRLGVCDSEKSHCIYESPHLGDVICASCPNSRTLVTGSTCTVVNVWEIVGYSGRSANVTLELRKHLYGHTEPVSCICASGSFGIIVSGSRDRSCIVWDLANLTFIRQLGPHPGPVSAVCINEATGDVGTASGVYLYLWSSSGGKLADVNTGSSSRGEVNEMIICIAFSTMNEWDPANVIITGTNTGVVKMWSLVYEPAKQNQEGDEHNNSNRMSRRSVSMSFVQSVATSELSRSPELSVEGVSFILGEDSDQPPESGVLSRLHSNIPRARSESSLADMPSSVKRPSLQNGPTQWCRRLVFRARLTMHTAFERKDNRSPAAVTALYPSRDHKTLFIGDSLGRIWAWTMGDRQGGRADHWVQDPFRNLCNECHQKFTLTERRHHCRNCGQLFCSKCSRFEAELKHLRIRKPVRVCQNCYVRLKAAEDFVFLRHSTPVHH